MMDNKTFISIGIVIALAIGLVAVFMASGDPDGLESSALVVQGQKDLTGDTPEDAELHEETEGRFSYTAPMPDYALSDEMGSAGGIIAIVFGTILAFAVVFGIAYGLKAAVKPLK